MHLELKLKNLFKFISLSVLWLYILVLIDQVRDGWEWWHMTSSMSIDTKTVVVFKENLDVKRRKKTVRQKYLRLDNNGSFSPFSHVN